MIRLAFLILGFLFVFAPAQQDSSKSIHIDSASVHPVRLAAVASLTSASFIASYALVFKDGWWDSSGNKFHFKNDFDYAKNLDKGGHFFAGVLLSEAFRDGFRWSGVSELNSYLLAGSMASLTHVGIDVKDGYSDWGYSPFDVLSGTLGGFYPMAKRYVPALRNVDYKFSYWRNSEEYWNQPGEHAFVATDDYCNQTHWLSLKINRMLPGSVEPLWPDWLALAAGVSVSETIFMGDEGYPLASVKREYFVGLDWDLEGLIKPRQAYSKRIVQYLNYVKLPAPTLQVYPVRKLLWAYPVKF